MVADDAADSVVVAVVADGAGVDVAAVAAAVEATDVAANDLRRQQH